MRRRAISLSRELWTIMHALQGVRVLSDHLGELPANCDRARSIPRAISATVVVLEARLMHLERVVCGEVNPGDLWSSSNDAGAADEAGEDDLKIGEWSPEESVSRARRELRRAKVERERQRARHASAEQAQGVGKYPTASPEDLRPEGRGHGSAPA
jgi:hypothetical protein